MDRTTLKALALYGNTATNFQVSNSSFWPVFERRLLGLIMICNPEEVLMGSNLIFEVRDNLEDVVESRRFIRTELSQRKSWQIEFVISNIMAGTDAYSGTHISTTSLRRNDQILQAIEENFYSRFAKEIDNWCKTSFIDWTKSDQDPRHFPFIKAIPLLVNFICDFAIKSVGKEAKSEKQRTERETEADSKTLCGFKEEEARSALERIGIEFDSLTKILAETKDKRTLLKISELYHFILKCPVIFFGLARDNRLKKLFQSLKESGLTLSDIGGSKEDLLNAYTNYYQGQLVKMTGIIQQAKDV